MSNHQHAFTHSTTRVSLPLRLQFLLPQLKTQVACSPPVPLDLFIRYKPHKLSSIPSCDNAPPPPQPHDSGAPSSCTSGGCLASGHRVFQSLLSSIQHQVPSPSIDQSVHCFLFLSWKRSPRTPALRAAEKKVEASSASAHNAQPRYPR